MELCFYKLPNIIVSNKGNRGGSLQDHPHLILGAFAISMYVEAEVTIESTFINYIGKDGLKMFGEAQVAICFSLFLVDL